MSHTPLNTLVAQQLPEFIRSDYATFVAFVEAYYAWMEEEGNALNQNRKLIESFDIDRTANTFVEFFSQQFIPGIPTHLLNNRQFFITHAKEFSRTKGTEKAFALLFRLLFNEEISLTYPKDLILKVSDGKWERDHSLRLFNEFTQTLVGDGTTKAFRVLAESSSIGSPSVYINDVLQTSGYFFSADIPYLVFTAAPSNGATIRIVYDAFQLLSLFNTNILRVSITGQTSGATAISEGADQLFLNGVELFDLAVSSIKGNFSINETITMKYIWDVDTLSSITLTTNIVSLISDIQITNGGANYNVGDYIAIVGGSPSISANAVIEEVFQAIITNISVANGGCGYQAGQTGYITSTPNTGLSMAISSVDKSGNVHPNSYPIVQDVLSLFDSVIMSNSNYGFLPAGNEDANTVIANALSTIVYGGSGSEGLGPIVNVSILISTGSFATSPTIKFDSPVVTVQGNTANGNTATANVSLGYFGILGRMNVVQGGVGYQVGDEIIITNQPGLGIGVGAAAQVTEVHGANSGIKQVQFQPTRVTGTVNVSLSAANSVVGTGTLFLTELTANAKISINTQTSYVQSITNNTHLIVNTNFTRASTDRKLGVFDRYFIGGINYSMNALPTLSVQSGNVSATGASLIAEGVISGGESLITETPDGIPGEILAIRLVHPGYGFITVPTIDLTAQGDGKATALAVLLTALFTSDGHYLSQDGMPSSDRKLQGVDTYYQAHSYVIKSHIELQRYASVLKNLLHPAGMQFFGELMFDHMLSSSANANVQSTITLTTP